MMFVSHYRACEKHLGVRKMEAGQRFLGEFSGEPVEVVWAYFMTPGKKASLGSIPFTLHTLLDYRLLVKNLLLPKAKARALS